MRNTHDLSQAELAEIFHDAGDRYVKNGDRLGYVHRLQALGISSVAIRENLVELDIARAELFNQALATMRAKRSRVA